MDEKHSQDENEESYHNGLVRSNTAGAPPFMKPCAEYWIFSVKFMRGSNPRPKRVGTLAVEGELFASQHRQGLRARAT